MKYDLLNKYRSYLEGIYSKDTARTYYNRLDILFNGQSLTDTADKLDIGMIIDNLSRIKHKNQFSQSKNAFLHFCKFQNIVLTSKHLEQITMLEKGTRKKYRKLQPVNFSDIDKKIKYLRNIKLKLSFQALLKTGLRVSELSQITPNDIVISNDNVILSFIGKGGNKEKVSIYKSEDEILFNRLLDLIQKTGNTKKVFYSAIYLQTKAKELGFTCHDLRRACAKIEYRKTKSKEDVKKKLRHSSIKNTNIYLKSKVKL